MRIYISFEDLKKLLYNRKRPSSVIRSGQINSLPLSFPVVTRRKTAPRKIKMIPNESSFSLPNFLVSIK